MDLEMDACFDPRTSSREQLRHYGKRHSTPTHSPARGGTTALKRGLLYEGHIIHSPSNAALLLENIKHEADSYDVADRFEGRAKDEEVGDGEWGRFGSGSIKACNVEDAVVSNAAETIFGSFASLLDG